MLKAVGSDKSVVNLAARANDGEGYGVAEYQIGCASRLTGVSSSDQYLFQSMFAPDCRRQKTSRRFQQALAHGYNGDNRRILQFADQIDLVGGARMDDPYRGSDSRNEWLHVFYEMIRDQHLGTNR